MPERSKNRVLAALLDPEFYKRDLAGRANEAAQGLAAGSLGALADLGALPLDMVTRLHNAATAIFFPQGYDVTINGHRVHRSGQLPLLNPESIIGGTDWVGRRMGANIRSPSFRAGTIGPTPDPTDVMRIIPALAGATAFHGSPHKFDKFDISKIGTGEGVQAYGHGLYFAENPNVARDYQFKLARDDGGAFYTVDIPDDAIDRMIDWDNILSEQPQEVQELARLWGLRSKGGADVFGRDIVREAERRAGGKRGASELFRNLGIPGIKYFDADSRASEMGTKNFVVFDDSLITLLKRE